jgi:hypothetical protein
MGIDRAVCSKAGDSLRIYVVYSDMSN